MNKTLTVLLILFCSVMASTTQAQNEPFEDFANDFINVQTTRFSLFNLACPDLIITSDEQGHLAKVKPIVAYRYLKYFFKFNNYKIKNEKIDFSDGEFTITLYFKVSDLNLWVLYKYDSIL